MSPESPESGDVAAQPEFELRILMTGILLHVFNREGTKIAVVMPDARRKKDDEEEGDGGQPTVSRRAAKQCHFDRTDAEPHAGYLGIDLRNLDTQVTGLPDLDSAELPAYEVLHRFDEERVELGLAEERGPIIDEMSVPALDGFAPILEPIRELLNPGLGAGVLMRMDLSGGRVSARPDGVDWKFVGDLHPAGIQYGGPFGGEVRWIRPIRAAGLHLRLVRFDGSRTVEIPLRPIRARGGKAAITIRIANLCKVNPLEWPELPEREGEVDDVDFKWLYRLLQAKDRKDWLRFLFARMPIPQPDKQGTRREGRVRNCLALRAELSF
jgi:hypothetical protein